MEEVIANAIFENYTLDEATETTIKVKVLADDKINVKEYNLIINKVDSVDELSDLGLTINVDGKEIAKDSTGNYVLEVENTVNTANVEVIAASKTTSVQIVDGEFILRKTSKDIALEEINTQIPITLENAEGTRRTVILNITKTSDDNNIKELKANGETIEAQEDGTYKVYVDQNSSSVELQAISQMELAKISINGNEETRQTNTENINIAEDKTKTIIVKITALNGDIREYTVNIEKRAKVTGKVITQSSNTHVSTITVYRTSDTRKEDDANDPREVVAQYTTSTDGIYELQLITGEYDIVVTKQSYLEYRLTNVTVETNETIPMEDINIYAGDINGDGQIELSDLTALTANTGEVTEENGKAIYDLNEDNIVDRLDRNILKANYNKKNVKEQWVVPEEIAKDRNNTTYILPVTTDYVISSAYGVESDLRRSKHTGIDLVPTWHSDIVSVADGEIVFAGVNGAFGNCIEIKHIINGEEIYSFYAHLSRIDVSVGDTVKQGQVIGVEGGAESDPNHGNSTGHHLHFEIRKASGYGNDVDPTKYIKF